MVWSKVVETAAEVAKAAAVGIDPATVAAEADTAAVVEMVAKAAITATLHAATTEAVPLPANRLYSNQAW